MKGALSVALLFTVLWIACFAQLVGALLVLRPEDFGRGEGPLVIARVLGGIGLLTGALFATAIALFERGRIPLARAAAWGALAAVVVPIASGRHDQVYVTCPVGALVAALVVLIVRKPAPVPA